MTPTSVPPPPVETRSSVLSRAAFVSIILFGLFADLALNGQRPGLGVPLVVAALVAIVLRLARVDGVRAGLLVASVAFAGFVALRTSEELVAIDVLVAATLFAFAVAPVNGSLATAGMRAMWAHVEALLQVMPDVPRFLRSGLPEEGPIPWDRVRRVLRSAAVALPVIGIFAVLLASADRVFGDLLTPSFGGWDLGSAVPHLLWFLAASIGAAIVVRATVGERTDAPQETMLAPDRMIRAADWVTLLVGLTLLFSTFVAVQLTVLFRGAHHVFVTPGLTYAEYARSGFFQLMCASGLTIVVIIVTWDRGLRSSRRHELALRSLSACLVGLCGVVLASAWMRLDLYEDAFGATVRRSVARTGIWWIAAMLVTVLAAMWTRRRRAVLPALLAVSLLALAAINVTNPDRSAADRNVERYVSTRKIDLSYLMSLSHDAVPAMARLLPRLPAAERRALAAHLCGRLDDIEDRLDDPRSFTLAARAAHDALEAVGITADAATCRARPTTR